MINYQAFPKPTKKKLVHKNISPIGKRTKRRLYLYGSETDLHNKVWESQEHTCCMCHTYIYERSPACFAHMLSKGMYSKYRYMPENIALVCSIDCHHKVDALYQGKQDHQIVNRNNLILLLDKLINIEKA